MGLFKIFFFVILIVAITAANNCAKPCPRDYRPICGFDGRLKTTFDNKCLFEIANCESGYKMNIIRNGKCPELTKTECNKICTLEYDPVCASNGHKTITYSNMCSFDAANCEANYKLHVISFGQCLEEEEKLLDETNCLRPCPLINLPVCGFDGENYQTFGNKCEFEVMNCITKNHLRFIKMGEC